MRKTRLHDFIGYALVCIVMLSPIPLGSNRPFFWMFWALVINLMGLAYFLRSRNDATSYRLPPSALWLPAVGVTILVGWATLSAMPLGRLVGPIEFQTVRGETITSNYLSLAPGSSLLAAIRLETYALFYFLALQVSVNAKRRNRLLRGTFLAIAAHAVFGLLALTQFGDTLLFVEKWGYLGSATGTFVNRNSFATFIAFGVVLGVAHLLDNRLGLRLGERSQIGIVSFSNQVLPLAILVSTLFATQSRMGLVAAFCGVLVVMVSSTGLSQRRSAILAIVGIGIVAITLYGVSLAGRLENVMHDAGGRLALYEQIVSMIFARPLLGYGPGAFEVAYPLFHELPVSMDFVWDKAHSSYLAMLLDYGFPLGLLGIAIVGVVGTRTWRSLRSGSDPVPAISALGVLTISAVHSLFDFSLEIQANMFCFLLVIACGGHLKSAQAAQT